MAKAQFHCAKCGDLVTIVGHNRSDADRKAKWHEAEGHLCDECEAKRLADEVVRFAPVEDDPGAYDGEVIAGMEALTGMDGQALARLMREAGDIYMEARHGRH